MSDIFREVEEDVRRERYEKLWKQYGDHIIAAAALVIIAAAGVQLYRVYEQREANKASLAYEAAAQLLDAGQPRAAEPQFAALARSAPGGYAKVSRLAEADALFGAGDRGAAVRLYEQIADGNDPYLGAVARLHAAWALVEAAPASEVEALLAPLLDRTSSWHSLAWEVVAYEDARSGNAAAALKIYQEIAADPNAPSALLTRARAMVRFLKAGGDANIGKVPLSTTAQTPASTRSNTGGPRVR